MRERGVKRTEILKTLREDILSGRYSAGCAFPSEVALSRRFGVSRTTMAFVMHELEELPHLVFADCLSRNRIINHHSSKLKSKWILYNNIIINCHLKCWSKHTSYVMN